jgi:BirA family biotin operon repressor/biotin-[acetyl-CoA-carboxylase] ligase
MKRKILEVLRNSKDYVSGQELCQMLGVSRTAVWKNINSLKAEGYIIEGVNNKGYRLVASPDNMSVESISAFLTTETMGRHIVCFDEVDSTNIRAKIDGETGGVDGSLYVADSQTAGKGRRGRSWSSDKGTTIAMSYLLKPDIDIERVSGITLVAALALAKTISQIPGIRAQIKWPNDLCVNGRKLVGILTEMSSQGRDITYVVVGIGINVYNREFPEEIADKATSIFLENGEGCDRSKLVANITNEFEVLYRQFMDSGDLSFMVQEYDSFLVNKGKQVYVIDGDSKTEYTALGLAKDGGLVVRDKAGKESVIISGEVSVRGIYGYV